MLAIAFYAGEYTGDASALTYMCDIEGSVTPGGRPPFTALEETQRVLQMCTERYATPALEGSALTVFIGRKKRGRITPLARLDILLQDGYAQTSIHPINAPRAYAEPLPADTADTAPTIARTTLP